MSLFNIFDVAGSGMSAQSVRLNVVASNLANADNLSGSEATAYRAKQPVFETVYGMARGEETNINTVKVQAIEQSSAPIQSRRRRCAGTLPPV